MGIVPNLPRIRRQANEQMLIHALTGLLELGVSPAEIQGYVVGQLALLSLSKERIDG